MKASLFIASLAGFSGLGHGKPVDVVSKLEARDERAITSSEIGNFPEVSLTTVLRTLEFITHQGVSPAESVTSLSASNVAVAPYLQEGPLVYVLRIMMTWNAYLNSLLAAMGPSPVYSSATQFHIASAYLDYSFQAANFLTAIQSTLLSFGSADAATELVYKNLKALYISSSALAFILYTGPPSDNTTEPTVASRQMAAAPVFTAFIGPQGPPDFFQPRCGIPDGDQYLADFVADNDQLFLSDGLFFGFIVVHVAEPDEADDITKLGAGYICTAYVITGEC